MPGAGVRARVLLAEDRLELCCGQVDLVGTRDARKESVVRLRTEASRHNYLEELLPNLLLVIHVQAGKTGRRIKVHGRYVCEARGALFCDIRRLAQARCPFG